MVKWTKIFILLVVVVAIVYDVYVYSVGGTQTTISWVIAEWSYKMPALVFAVGFLCGHLFWQMDPDKFKRKKIDGR